MTITMPNHAAEPVSIRPARPHDAAAIAAVAAKVWPDEPLDPAAIARLIGSTARATSVGELGGKVVGFVDGFITETTDGEARWEVDLLAVSPQAQGRGIGRALVAASVGAGVALGAVRARALIRSGNVASERVFRTCGFTPDAFESRLWIAAGLAPPKDAEPGRVIPVKTFRYAGDWLEQVTADSLRLPRRCDQAGILGAVIPCDQAEVMAATARAGMQPEGNFRFWQRSLR